MAKGLSPEMTKKNVFYAFITWQITPLQLYISILIYTVQLYYYCSLLFIEIKKKNKLKKFLQGKKNVNFLC